MKKKSQNKGIANEISVKVLAVVIAAFLVVGAVVGLMVSNVSITAEKKQLTQDSQLVVHQIDGFFEKYMTVAEQLAVNADAIQLMKNTDTGETMPEQEIYEKVYAQMESIVATDPENIMAAWVAEIDSNSLVSTSGFISDETYDMAIREWFQTTKTGQPMVTEPFDTGFAEGEVIMSAACPVFDEAGNVIGVAGVDILLTQMSEVLSQYKIGDTGFVMMISSTGNLIYHPNKEIQLSNIADLDFSAEILEHVQNGQEDFFDYKVLGTHSFGYLGKIGDSQFYILSCLPGMEYYQDMAWTLIVTAFVMIIGIVAVILNIKKVAVGITKPIISLNDVAQQLADGNLDVELSVQADNEIGELSDSIGKTVDRLKKYIDYINEITGALDRLADGKLKVELYNEYTGEFAKVKDALLNISSSMQLVMENIMESSVQVYNGAEGLAKGARSLAESTTTQAAAVEELTAITNTFTEQVNSNSEDAKDSARETKKVAEMMEHCKEQMAQMMEAMKKIDETSSQVVSIIKTIEEIADQTNLLSLNASIEAARAGEAGKGFAVVASEIGSLAAESAKAANNTRDLIAISIQEINHGDELAKAVVDSLEEVLKATEAVNELIMRTADNSQVQAEGIEQIRIGVEEFARGVEDSSIVAQGSSDTSEELAEQAATLTELIKRFELN